MRHGEPATDDMGSKKFRPLGRQLPFFSVPYLAQILGFQGAAKRIDILATALHNSMTVQEIAELDLSYAPPFAPVWDPILIAANQAVKKIRQ